MGEGGRERRASEVLPRHVKALKINCTCTYSVSCYIFRADNNYREQDAARFGHKCQNTFLLLMQHDLTLLCDSRTHDSKCKNPLERMVVVGWFLFVVVCFLLFCLFLCVVVVVVCFLNLCHKVTVRHFR